MKSLLIINVDAKPINGAERFLAEPAMGNQKAGGPEYAAKWQEKRNKQLQDLQEHSFLATPVSIQYALLSVFQDGYEGAGSLITLCSVADFFNSVTQAASGQVDIIAGVHPTTHSRVLLNTAIRHGVKIPGWFFAAERVNPWAGVCTQAEGGYPLPWVGLGQKPLSPVEDTIALLRATGAGILRRGAPQ